MTLALNTLGFRTLHPNHWYQEPKALDLWHQDIVLPSIQNGIFQLGTPDFSRFAALGYAGLADMPVCFYYRQLLQDFPDCKFVLTTRRSADVWLRSMTNVQGLTTFMHYAALFIPKAKQYSDYYRWLFSFLTQNNDLLSASWPTTQILSLSEREHAMELYQSHNQRVRETIPSNRLLEFRLGTDGWEALCEFLDVVEECPTTAPFPRSNSPLCYTFQVISSVTFVVGCFYFVVFRAWFRGSSRNVKTTKTKTT